MDEMIRQANQRDEDKEMKEKKKPKTKKEYTPLGERFLNSNAGLTQKEVIELSNIYKKQLAKAIKGVGPKIVTIETAANMFKDEPKRKKRTSAYITAVINGRKIDVIMDTGAGFNLITKGLADELNMDLNRPVSTPMRVTDGHKSVPLGELDDILLTIGPVTIPFNAVVTAATTYQVILGNEWIDKVQANIDFKTKKLKMIWKGRKIQLTFDIRKGLVDESEEIEEDEEEEEQEDKEPYLMVEEWESNDEMPPLNDGESTDEEEEKHQSIYQQGREIEVQCYNEQSYRYLNIKEKRDLQDFTMKMQQCPMYEQRVYCAKLMCTCANTMMIN
jgi:hypothetical protein